MTTSLLLNDKFAESLMTKNRDRKKKRTEKSNTDLASNRLAPMTQQTKYLTSEIRTNTYLGNASGNISFDRLLELTMLGRDEFAVVE